ncbi:MAG: ATP-binding cassette domain-containing protein, partial [Methanomicrobiales archaeon]|nr:ATP-binding cassette domain-containing protein [Methanomicrobiales archaeon]
MNNTILDINSLCAGYEQGDILKEISLKIDEQSFIGIIGPNGSGKSTFMQVIARSLSFR